MNGKISVTHNRLRESGVYVQGLASFNCDIKYMKRGDVFRVTVDIPADQISEKRDVRAMFGDSDCKLIPALAFIENE